ncbi:hypothetical protein PanWU01x14_340210 [Parasponia andersonii]|uniref:Uncharacterized protein n=1 Tax=Parasponia andersonii TaxID=3476 RepID=A0A2P5AEF9_PARAD|nr:hypothetical protein PanWU01x14_340210 [Parasponia andersonii]
MELSRFETVMEKQQRLERPGRKNGVRVLEISEASSNFALSYTCSVLIEEDTHDLERGDLESDGSSITQNHKFQVMTSQGRIRIICDLLRDGYMRPLPQVLCDLLRAVCLDKQKTYKKRETHKCYGRNLQGKGN